LPVLSGRGAVSTARLIARALEGRKEGKEWRCRCPVHGGRSLMVGDADDGTPLVHCHQGCEQENVIDALNGLGLWPSRNGASHLSKPAGVLEAEYPYFDPDGNVQAIKKRIRESDGGKRFEWWRPGAEKPGLNGLKERDLLVYNGHLLPADDGPVFVVEGEKAADACLDAGLLGVCAAGGASVKDFGAALDTLKGREVVLWPDNDDPGRDLMRRVAQRLEGVARVRWFGADVPDKGDAWDYFHSGGTKAQVLEALEQQITQPMVEQTTTGYLVTIPAAGGLVRFRFDGLEHRRRSTDADVTVWQEIPGVTREPFTARLDTVSLSNRESFRRQLDEMFGKGMAWTSLLNRGCQMARQALLDTDPSVNLLAAELPAPRSSLLPPLIMAGPNMLFGQGGAAKTTIAQAIGSAVAAGAEILGLKSLQAAVLFLDYEDALENMQPRARMLVRGADLPTELPFHYWPARGIPLPEMVPALLRKISEANIGLLIVDSAALAAGGEPERAETAIRYFNALAQLGIPSLIIAHVTKGDEDQWPFGSIFWHNSARNTWNVKLLQEQEEDVVHVGLFHRKSNTTRRQAPIGLRIEFGLTAIRIDREELQPERAGEVSLAKRIERALASGAGSVNDLAKEFSTKQETVRRTLNRNKGRFRNLDTKAADGSDLWGLKA
jgi:AAA domain